VRPGRVFDASTTSGIIPMAGRLLRRTISSLDNWHHRAAVKTPSLMFLAGLSLHDRTTQDSVCRDS
jgi:hypothetical protein